MDRALPEFNTILHKKWIQETKRLNKKKLQAATSRVDNGLPTAYKYPIVKTKKEMMIEERCSEIERANRILLERMTSILAGPATHNQKGLGYAKTAMARRPTFSSKKRGATALPSSSGARAFLMSGIQNPAAPGGVEHALSSKPTGSDHASPSMGKGEFEGTELHDPQILESAVSLPEGPPFAQNSLQMVQTKQDREKRNADTFYDTAQIAPVAYGQPRVRIAGPSPGSKPGKKMSLSQLKNRKLNRFQGHAYGMRSQSPGRSPAKQALAGSDPGQPDGQIDIEDQQNRGAHHQATQSGLLPAQEAGLAAMARAQPFFGARQKKGLAPIPRGRVGESLNGNQRRQEMSRILLENEALLKRLQNRQSNYNVWSWENERKQQIKRIKQICLYPPSISKRKRYHKKTKGFDLLDMEKRYASAGPNKQMYDMYNLSMRNTVEGSQGQVTGLASLSALQDAAMPDGQGAQSQANFANPGLLAARVDQNSMSTSAIQYENQRMQEEDDAERGKPGTANPRPNADFGTDSVFRVVSRDGQRQVSSTHADEVRDQVRALGDGQEGASQDGQEPNGGESAERNAGDQVTQERLPPLGEDQGGDPEHPELVGLGVPGNLTLHQFASTTQDMQAPNSQNAGIVADVGRQGGLSAKPGKRKKQGKGQAARAEVSPGVPGTLSAMHVVDPSLGGTASNMALTHQAKAAHSFSGNMLPAGANDFHSRDGIMPNSVNMNDNQAQGSSLHSTAGKAPPSKNQINIVAKKRPPSMPIKNYAEHGIDPKRKVLYRNFHDIDGVIYLVEISRNALKVFILLFPNFEAPDIFLFESMAEKKAQKLMTESNNMFEELVTKFHVKHGKLQIQGFHGMANDPRKHGSPGNYSRFSNNPSVKRNTGSLYGHKSQIADRYGYGSGMGNSDPNIGNQTAATLPPALPDSNSPDLADINLAINPPSQVHIKDPYDSQQQDQHPIDGLTEHTEQQQMLDKPSGATESAEYNQLERIEAPMGGLEQPAIEQPLTMNALDPAVAQSEPDPRAYQFESEAQDDPGRGQGGEEEDENGFNSQDYEEYDSQGVQGHEGIEGYEGPGLRQSDGHDTEQDQQRGHQ